MDESAWNSSSNQWNISSDPSKNIDEHGKKSSLEDDPVKIIGTRPPISFHVSTIAQNIVIPIKIVSVKKNQIIIGNLVENTIPRVIKHNLHRIYNNNNKNKITWKISLKPWNSSSNTSK